MNVWYMNGAGNDFMVIDARGQKLDLPALALELCKLTGADGFMAVDRSDKADFKLHFYNSDGSRGEMCGNGSRCICRFAYENGIAGESMTVETDAGIVSGWRFSADIYRVKLNNPDILDLDRKPDVAYVELGTPGVPHAVKEVPGLTWQQADTLKPMAKALRFDPAFPKGANANLYTWLDDTTVRILSSLGEESAAQLDALVAELTREYAAAKADAPEKNDLTALFNIGYGLYVVTSNDGKKDNGLIVNTVSQVTNTPKRVAVCINKQNYSHHVIKQTGVMNVNCLST